MCGGHPLQVTNICTDPLPQALTTLRRSGHALFGIGCTQGPTGASRVTATSFFCAVLYLLFDVRFSVYNEYI